MYWCCIFYVKGNEELLCLCKGGLLWRRWKFNMNCARWIFSFQGVSAAVITTFTFLNSDGLTCTNSSSAYLSRLSSHSAPSRSSRSLWASVLAPVISSLIFCSRFCFSTATVRFSSWAFSSLWDEESVWNITSRSDINIDPKHLLILPALQV